MSEMPVIISVGVIANDPLARAGLAMLLAGELACDVLAQSSLDDWLADLEADEWPPQLIDALVWDVGWEPLASLPEMEPLPLPAVALLPDETAVPHLWQLGVLGLLRREAPAAAIVAAVQAVLQGIAVIDPDFVTAVLPNAPSPTMDPAETAELTPREREVLDLLAEGLTNKAIAQRLAISDHTVKFHVNAILGKLNAQSRTEAVVQATRQGLLLL